MYIYIRAMSEAQRDVYDKIVSVNGEIVEHIAKLILFPSAQERHHWQREIFSFLNYVPKLKGRNKLPKKAFILDALQTKNDIIDNLIFLAADSEYSLTPREIGDNIILSGVEAYQEWLSTELATSGRVGHEAVFAKLDEIINATL